jgi:hypothetical protein
MPATLTIVAIASLAPLLYLILAMYGSIVRYIPSVSRRPSIKPCPQLHNLLKTYNDVQNKTRPRGRVAVIQSSLDFLGSLFAH